MRGTIRVCALAGTALLASVQTSACNQSARAPQKQTSTVASHAPKVAALDAHHTQNRTQPGKCKFSAWVHDNDPNGTNLRSGPGLSFAVIAKLPAARKTDEGGLTGLDAVTFRAVEARAGWFRITDVMFSPLGHDDRAKRYPDGWIHGSKIGFVLQSDFAFTTPDPSSRQVATSWQNEDGLHEIAYREVDDCSGEWVHLKVKDHDPRERPAWVRGVCGMLETTCDGLPGDYSTDDKQLPTY